MQEGHKPKACAVCVPPYPTPCKCGGIVHGEKARMRQGAKLDKMYEVACTLCDDPWPKAEGLEG